MTVWRRIAEAIGHDGRAALVSISDIEGSTPREAGARMVVTRAGFSGTIGGGALEHAMLSEAYAMLEAGAPAGRTIRQALGPTLGQCCGGAVTVRLETFGPADLKWIAPLAGAEPKGPVATIGLADAHGRLIRRSAAPVDDGAVRETFGIAPTPLLLFGAGHVGRALALALGPLPFAVAWVDQRPDAFPEVAPGNVTMRRIAEPLAALSSARDGALVAIMTHSHPLDLALTAAALGDGRFPYVGLIGSATKRARFVAQLGRASVAGAALDRLACPIGGRLLKDKSPAVIAAAVAVELLAARERYALPR